MTKTADQKSKAVKRTWKQRAAERRLERFNESMRTVTVHHVDKLSDADKRRLGFCEAA
jgi:hypothetical protein